MTLRRMRTKTRWVNKYLIPYTMLSIILTICMTLRRMRTSTDQLWPDLYINLSFLSVTTGRKRTRKKEKKWTNGKEQLDIYAFHLTTPDWPMDIKIMFLKLSRVLCTCTWSNVKHLFPAFCNDYMYIMSKSFVLSLGIAGTWPDMLMNAFSRTCSAFWQYQPAGISGMSCLSEAHSWSSSLTVEIWII